jgi:hypothetical protein
VANCKSYTRGGLAEVHGGDESTGHDAFAYLDAIDPRKWCKAFFEELPKFDLLLNNICEVFNK